MAGNTGILYKMFPEAIKKRGAILAAWYYNKRKIDTTQACEISGMNRDDFIAFASGKDADCGWIEKAQLLQRKRNTMSAKEFRKWLSEQNWITLSYAFRLSKALRTFGGTELARVPINRILMIETLPIDDIESLRTKGSFTRNGETITAQDLATMSKVEFRRLIWGNDQIRPNRWVEKARFLEKKKKEMADDEFQKWLSERNWITPYYANRLLNALRLFGDTDLEKAPIKRIFDLERMSKEHIESLSTKGYLLNEGKKVTARELATMDRLEFRKFIDKTIETCR